MRERGLLGLLVMLAFALLVGCGSSPKRSEAQAPAFAGGMRGEAMEDTESGESFADADPAPDSPMEMLAENRPTAQQPTPAPPPAPPTANDGTTGAEPVKQTGPLLIYTANYTMAVYEVTASIDSVQALAKELGGYLVRRDDRTITIRVPAEKYRGALGAVAKLGDVLHHEETVEDVTEQFFDMKTRLDNARALRTRLQELLAAAKDVNDALAVEKELARVTETIERMEGKLKRLRELINFSTITVSFNARGGESVNSKVNLPFDWLGQLGLGPLLQL